LWLLVGVVLELKMVVALALVDYLPQQYL